MFDLFKKKSDMRVFNMMIYFDNWDFTVQRNAPKKLEKVFSRKRDKLCSKDVNSYLLSTNYMRLKPDRFKNENLTIFKKWPNYREIDVEEVTINFWVSSERFKEFSERENLWFEFFPVLVEDKRKYLMSWRALPTFRKLDLDTEETNFNRLWTVWDGKDMCFRSDVLEYYSWKVFCDNTHISKYITWEIKDKMEQENCRKTFNRI